MREDVYKEAIIFEGGSSFNPHFYITEVVLKVEMVISSNIIHQVLFLFQIFMLKNHIALVKTVKLDIKKKDLLYCLMLQLRMLKLLQDIIIIIKMLLSLGISNLQVSMSVKL